MNHRLNRISKTLLITTLAVLSLSAPSSGATHHRASTFTTPIEWRTSGPGVQYPDSHDLTLTLPRIDQLAFACIRYDESRNHLIDGLDSEGWYQFTDQTWHAAALVLHLPLRLMWHANLASGDLQSRVAVWYFRRNGRFGVQWLAEAGRCPGRF